jgi:asparagine synthase (glutamine-hydrolysing)
MCGIAGFIDFTKETSESILKEMINSFPHRGPDDQGIEIIENDNVSIGLAQARLSIIDLTFGGHQPMSFEHLTIVFNGEVYNYQEIRIELEILGHIFVTSSDTEVILHAFYEWGKKCVNRFIGMFVYVIYDSKSNNITFTRDRAGVKPIYYYWNEKTFIFGSELKSILVHPKFEKKIQESVLSTYFDLGYVPAPFSIFKNTFKIEPGCHLELSLIKKTITIEKYWEVEKFYKLPKLNLRYHEAKEQLKKIIESACQYRMVADVPVGVFLSGGYDSTLVTSILQNNRSEKLNTFTIGFEEGNNEAPYAKETANYLGTNHTEYVCTAKEAQEIIPTLPFFYDEPFADSSAIPTILVSKLAKKQVTVVLSADAGDEVFCGYTSYQLLDQYLAYINFVPDFMKFAISKIGFIISDFIPFLTFDKKHKIKSAFKSMQRDKSKQASDLFRYMNSLPEAFQNKLFLNNNNNENSPYNINSMGFTEPFEVAQAIDYKGYLQNDILTKVDRATMSVSIEGREPLVDHRILEFAAQLPLEYKWDGIARKKILKDIVHDYVPKSMLDRPKAGFSLPIYSWLRGDLSYLIDEHLSPEALNQSSLFNVKWVTEQVDLFKSNKLHYQPFIWKLLMFQMWYAKWMK